MNQAENLIKVGKAVLTPQAISFIETLQDENNSIISHYDKLLKELIIGVQVFIHDDAINTTLSEKLQKNMGELASFSFDLDNLKKP